MEDKRKEEITIEAIRRLNLWLKNSSFEEMSVGGSMLRFEMALGLSGYPFKKESWMKDSAFTDFVSLDEFESDEYDEIVDRLYDMASSGMTNISLSDFYEYQ